MAEMSDIVANLEGALSTQTTNLERIRGDQTLQIELLRQELDKVSLRHQDTRDQLALVHSEAKHAREAKMNLEKQLQDWHSSDSMSVVTSDSTHQSSGSHHGGGSQRLLMSAPHPNSPSSETRRVLQELEEAQRARKALEAEVHSLQSTLAAKHVALQATEEQRNEAHGQAESCQQTVDDLLIENAHLSTQLEDARAASVGLEAAVQERQRQLEESQQLHDQCELELQARTQQKQDVEQGRQKTEQALEERQRQLEAAHWERDQLQERVHQLQEQQRYWKDSERQRQRERADSRDWAMVEQRRLAEELKSLQKRTKVRDKQITEAVEGERRQTRQGLAQLGQAFAALQEAALGLATQRKAARTKPIPALKDETAQTDLVETPLPKPLQIDRDVQTDQLADPDRRNELRESLAHLQRHLHELHANFKAAKTAADGRTRRLQNQLDSKQSEVDDLHTQHNGLQLQHQRLQAKYDVKKSEFGVNTDADEERLRLEAELVQASQECQQLREQLQQSMEQSDQVRHQLERLQQVPKTDFGVQTADSPEMQLVNSVLSLSPERSERLLRLVHADTSHAYTSTDGPDAEAMAREVQHQLATVASGRDAQKAANSKLEATSKELHQRFCALRDSVKPLKEALLEMQTGANRQVMQRQQVRHASLVISSRVLTLTHANTARFNHTQVRSNREKLLAQQLAASLRTCKRQANTLQHTESALTGVNDTISAHLHKIRQLQGQLRLMKDLYQHESTLRSEYEERMSSRTTELLQAELSLYSVRDALKQARDTGSTQLRHSVEVSIQTSEVAQDAEGQDASRHTASASVQTFYVRFQLKSSLTAVLHKRLFSLTKLRLAFALTCPRP